MWTDWVKDRPPAGMHLPGASPRRLHRRVMPRSNLVSGHGYRSQQPARSAATRGVVKDSEQHEAFGVQELAASHGRFGPRSAGVRTPGDSLTPGQDGMPRELCCDDRQDGVERGGENLHE